MLKYLMNMNLNEYENEFVLLITYDDNYISDKPLGLSGQKPQLLIVYGMRQVVYGMIHKISRNCKFFIVI